MLYISLAQNKDNAIPEKFLKLPKVIRECIYYLRVQLGCILEKKIENKSLIILPKINRKILNKLERYIKVNCVKNVCISKALEHNEEFQIFIKGQAVRILDGRWLFNQLIIKVIEYIVQCKKEKMEYQEVSILTNDIDEVLVDHITQLATKVKLLNIITTKEGKFRKIEKKLYQENGIILNINNNYKKSLLKSDMIVNVDFNEEEVNKYNLPKRACIINLKEEIKINQKSFEGINVFSYELTMPRKYVKYLLYFEDFSTSKLYESFIYKRTTTQNIKREIDEDEVNIIFLNGKNGKIRKQEYIRLAKNGRNVMK